MEYSSSLWTRAVVLVTLAAQISGQPQSDLQLSCNGLPEYCDLAVDQFTFPGTHNSGAGFNGQLKQCDGDNQHDCIWRSQGLKISDQLELGIRFLNLDTCFLPDRCNDTIYGDLSESRLFVCHGDEDEPSLFTYRYAGPVLTVFEQVNDWMNANSDEVVVLHFTEDNPNGEQSEIAREVIRLLDRMWNTSNVNLAMNTYYNQSGQWPTLRQAISSRQRIIVLIDEGLNVDGISRPWINPSPFSTFVPNSWSTDCSGKIFEHAMRCNTSTDFVLATGFTHAQCIPEGQMNCNLYLHDASYVCRDLRLEYNQTVNALLVDFPEQASDPNTVFDVARVLNAENVRRYLGIIGPDTTAAAPGSESKPDESTTEEDMGSGVTATEGGETLKYTLLANVLGLFLALHYIVF